MTELRVGWCNVHNEAYCGNGLLALQIGLVDVLREEYGITPGGILGHSAGRSQYCLIVLAHLLSQQICAVYRIICSSDTSDSGDFKLRMQPCKYITHHQILATSSCACSLASIITHDQEVEKLRVEDSSHELHQTHR